MTVFISTVLLLVLAVPFFYIVLPWCVRNVLKRKFLSSVKGSSCACLTFDDGPDNEFTPGLLKLLKDEGIKATFFVTGKNAEKYPQLCEEIISQGHEIGEHGYHHVHPWLSSPFASLSDLIAGSSIIKKHCGITKDLMLRPPYGKLNLITLCYVLLRKRKLAFWNIDPKDYSQQSPEAIAENVCNQLTDGAVILFHDRTHNSSNALENKLAAIKIIVNRLKEYGYSFPTISNAIELCEKNNINGLQAAYKYNSTRKIAPDVKLGRNVKIYDFVNIYGCEIGDNSKIGTFVEIQKGAKIGKNCKISSHTFVCEGVTIEDDVFIGHNVTFINDKYPRATNGNGRLQTEKDWACVPSLVKKGASIGSGTTLLCGVTVGRNAIIGAGSVVVGDIPDDTIAAGNPARIFRKINVNQNLVNLKGQSK